MDSYCLNCQQLLSGEYCASCGQRERGRDIRVSDLAEDVLEDLSHLDSRLWRTLKGLMLRPGYITAEYLVGRRACFVPPLRLYFILSFLVFVVVSAVPVDLDAEQEQQGIVVSFDDEGEDSKSLGEALKDRRLDQSLDSDNYDLPLWLKPYEDRMRANAEAIEDNPEAFVALLQQRLPQMMFVLLPLFALILWLNYLFSPYHYLQHLIFSLHFHSFAFLLFLLQWLLGLVRPGDYLGWIFLALLIYLPIALTRVYQSAIPAAIAKSLFINFAYFLLVILAGVGYVLVNLALL
jgi:hypothetical protein